MPASDYRAADFYQLLNANPPAVHRIHDALRDWNALECSLLLSEEPECVYLIDYYFRLFEPEIGARLINDADFALSAAAELFNCQLIRYYRSLLSEEKSDYSSLIHSYWKLVDKDRFLEILRLTMSKDSIFSAVFLLQQVDQLDFLRNSERFPSGALLDFFKSQGRNLLEYIQNNLDLYDYIYGLARQMKDTEYLHFLDEFTSMVVELRIIGTLAEEHSRKLEPGEKMSLKQLVTFLDSLPASSHTLAMDLLKRRELIEPGTASSMQEFRSERHETS